MNTKKKGLLGLLGAAALLVTGTAAASTTGGEFQVIYQMIVDWTNGYLGKTIAILAFTIGLGMGVARSNPVPAIAGLIFAMFVAFGPGVLDGIVTAVV